jgi:predicted heme/steroid binding protein
MNGPERAIWQVCPACGRIFGEEVECDGLPLDEHEPTRTIPREYERSEFTDYDGPAGPNLVATEHGPYDMTDHDLGAFVVDGWHRAEEQQRREMAEYRWVCLLCGRQSKHPGECDRRDERPHDSNPFQEDSPELVEAKWAQIDELLRLGDVDVEGAVEMLFAHSLVRKAHGPHMDTPPDADQLWSLEIGRWRPLVPGPRIIVANPGRGPRHAAMTGRIYRPVESTIRWDTGAYSTEF